MEEYDYHVEDGQFSFDFRAPLLGKEGDKLKLYDFMPNNGIDEIEEMNEITIDKIDRENLLVECWGSVE